ncbi:hypothetical protein CBW57_04390 [Yersinia intermedia]|uniref:Gluconate 5-dehydrogenase n=1 Tax=Yersinia intermedia TaxID=631 RepID=A0A209A841_YERIN|nr:hypothetical protein CBW57_04390 [Yersinia intermedia]
MAARLFCKVIQPHLINHLMPGKRALRLFIRMSNILLTSAGVNRRKPIKDVSAEDSDAIIDINLRSVYFLAQAVQPYMAKQGGGKIVNISSLSAKHAFNTISVYAASKTAVSQLTKAMAHEWVGDNIQVNAIEPGFIKTEFTRPLWDDEYRSKWFQNFIPQGV